MPVNNVVAPVGVPAIGRRLVSMVYELLLGFAVLFLPFLVFEMLVKASHAPAVEHMRQALAFLVLGAYFIHQWTRKGQTLAMQTWRIRLQMPDGAMVPPRVATLRYLLCWLWVLPAAAVCLAFDLHRWQAIGALAIGIVAWSLTALLDRERQFLHDRIAGTRLVQLPKPEKRVKAAA
ncbi:RDD family protein [Pseudoduganella armeniaca]|uniref:RDD family protein n=1 Tax=Pseudoduganella armeniaca TaxID=2072590 RepID=A0A2R4CEA0_9BURK|nr:RDD family protein [Pseudoduganella armeniaca]AVR97800.1 RDD family protein [Pseudoduganella armeniaca]